MARMSDAKIATEEEARCITGCKTASARTASAPPVEERQCRPHPEARAARERAGERGRRDLAPHVAARPALHDSASGQKKPLGIKTI